MLRTKPQRTRPLTPTPHHPTPPRNRHRPRTSGGRPPRFSGRGTTHGRRPRHPRTLLHRLPLHPPPRIQLRLHRIRIQPRRRPHPTPRQTRIAIPRLRRQRQTPLPLAPRPLPPPLTVRPRRHDPPRRITRPQLIHRHRRPNLRHIHLLIHVPAIHPAHPHPPAPRRTPRHLLPHQRLRTHRTTQTPRPRHQLGIQLDPFHRALILRLPCHITTALYAFNLKP
jgi:hypothetical protein